MTRSRTHALLTTLLAPWGLVFSLITPACNAVVNTCVDHNDCLATERCDQARRRCVPKEAPIELDGGVSCTASDEICDGLDNDCDGEIDELEIIGLPCLTGRPGICASGTWHCNGESGRACEPTEVPHIEQCNGLDDDCDGHTDEGDDNASLTRACYTGPDETARTGVCQNGTQICYNGEWPTGCPGQILPTPEGCDGHDNDCDGAVDEEITLIDQPCMTDQPGICALGTWTCTLEEGLMCHPNVEGRREICDGLDNDCNRAIDDHIERLDEPCLTGRAGVCAIGTWRCDGVLGLTCHQTDEAGFEICNGIDDDCNGEVDDGEIGQDVPCETGLPGNCAAGTTICRAADGIECHPNRQPVEESCDGLDNDCDGAVDEEITRIDQPCMTDQPGICAAGTWTCTPDEGLVCHPNVEGRREICDGLDNDCDGEVDEDFNDGATCCVGDNIHGPPCNGCPEGSVVPDGMVCIPAGEFVMGSPGPECPDEENCIDPRCDSGQCPEPEVEGPPEDYNEHQHHVQLTRPFLLQTTEVTLSQWVSVTGIDPSWCSREGDGVGNDPCADRPVESVSWLEAVTYLNMLSAGAGLMACYALECPQEVAFGTGCPEGQNNCYGANSCNRADPVQNCTGYRLPTEAEWEYAARAGIAESRSGPLEEIAWYDSNSGVRSHTVGQRAANAWSLHDMLGNVSEFTYDRYGDYPAGPVIDPMGPANGNHRVVRGRHFAAPDHSMRVANRHTSNGDSYRNKVVGFRSAKSID